MKKIFFLAAMVCTILSSCSKTEPNDLPNPQPTPEVSKMPISLTIGKWTRANDTTFESGDKVGIYVVNYDGSAAGALAASGNQVDNMRFTMELGLLMRLFIGKMQIQQQISILTILIMLQQTFLRTHFLFK